MKILVQFSGGKDSQACLIYAVEKYGAKNVTAVFCDTGWEHEITYKHVQDVCKQMNVGLEILKAIKYKNLVDLAKKKKRFPSVLNRFCSYELKTVPFIDYILDVIKDSVVVFQGIRAEESINRAKMEKECGVFKYYLQPLYKDKDGRTKYDNYRTKEVKQYLKHHSADIIRPVFDWTGNQVMEYILSHGQKPNQLYYEGLTRVGCFPCIMARLGELKTFIKAHPELIDRVRDAEHYVGGSFFPLGYIPDRYVWTSKDGVKVNYIDDIASYVLRHENQISMFDEDDDTDRRCMSIYNICE